MTMKKNKIVTAFLMLTLFFSVNNSIGQTTQEEYNYVTKGYKVQLESGLDMKKGYTLKHLGEWEQKKGTENRKCEFKGLIKQGQTKPSAIMMIYKRTDIPNGASDYICIPSADAPAEMWQQTYDFINANSRDNYLMMQTIIWALMKFSSQEVTK